MKERVIKKRYLILLLGICMLLPQWLLQKPQTAVAASNAIVIVGTLNVRTGPGTTYDRVVVDGMEAYLVGQQEIEVTGTTGEWYKINASFRGKEIYDPVSDAWYWCDGVQGGAIARSKDVYQDSFAGVC